MLVLRHEPEKHRCLKQLGEHARGIPEQVSGCRQLIGYWVH